jgi:hypothetical protein
MTSGWPKSAGPCCITRLAPPASPATRSGARRPSPRPARADGDARRAEGGASTIGAEPAAGWRTIFLPVIRQGRRAATRQDAHAQPERPWRRCAGVIASGRPKSAGSGGHNALRARDAGAGSGANCRAPSRRPPGRGRCARAGGARIHDGEGAGRDGRVRPAFRWRPCRLAVDEPIALRATAGGRIAGESRVRGPRPPPSGPSLASS